ncbi:LacI family transcriptional regulator [Thermolongibacillus altinsuensis]|jgi:LacI family repressor for deo operon, udp, cdd, tsx, nupC, and nupG|uniref:LacI family transcriptional regulator n=1 Tax=Thermolongibacillus altinsuensis TaxID=575256 RepID=A0A4V2QAF6_9BACL|nr:LacI family DNA-binding transcriptional regulator [Thermolongibacillus altinsuensis]TCL51187.1 LacI family transcriptional regulator [Thermolongibacillus altinsuensis]GMB08745.1 LacI family transcriptional regulator [Thermolongibacillus altinsuensis]
MANIREIAKIAGVSVATVSRVLNGYPYVKEEKRNAVWEAVEKLNYTKNINAVHLAKGKTSIIGVVLPYVNHPYFSTIVEGISIEALRYGYHLLLFQTNYEEKKEIEALEMLKMKQVDGMIICSRTLGWKFIEAYKEYGPIVLCEDVKGRDLLSVYINHYEAFMLGMEYLIEKGHRKIGYCIGRTTGTNSKDREAAYRDALRKINESPRQEWIFDHCLYIEDGKRVVNELLAMREKPTALLVSSDQVAAGIVLWGQSAGWRIPEDLAILSFDNHPISEALQITTMDLPLSIMGKKAFRMIYHSFQNNETVKAEKLEVRLIERSSV